MPRSLHEAMSVTSRLFTIRGFTQSHRIPCTVNRRSCCLHKFRTNLKSGDVVPAPWRSMAEGRDDRDHSSPYFQATSSILIPRTGVVADPLHTVHRYIFCNTASGGSTLTQGITARSAGRGILWQPGVNAVPIPTVKFRLPALEHARTSCVE
ncbi:hypothetical protein BKA93DRAFT_33659 [Sparassis latifolia]